MQTIILLQAYVRNIYSKNGRKAKNRMNEASLRVPRHTTTTLLKLSDLVDIAKFKQNISVNNSGRIILLFYLNKYNIHNYDIRGKNP